MSNRHPFPFVESGKSYICFEEVPSCFAIFFLFSKNNIGCCVYFMNDVGNLEESRDTDMDKFGISLSDGVDVVDDSIIDNKLGIHKGINDPSWSTLEDVLFNINNSELNISGSKFAMDFTNGSNNKIKIKLKRFKNRHYEKNIGIDRVISNLNYLMGLKRKKK